MSHIYMKFDFGTDEGKAQSARHKLDVWKQAFRLDKKLQYKLERPEPPAGEPAEASLKPEKAERPAAKSKAKGKAKPAAAEEKAGAAPNGKVSLLVRLYFSSHEKLSEQRWLDRIPSEEPFKDASPQVIRQNDPAFASSDKLFEDLQ
jgi:hypothetical protein